MFIIFARYLTGQIKRFMAISMKDIAQALNISKTTVSWILSGQGEAKGFSTSTIKLVEQYASEINYRPNRLARSLSTGSTYTLGLILPSIGDTYFAQMALAIEAEAEKRNYVLTICSSKGDPRREMMLIQMLREKQVDGLIIVPSGITFNGINTLLNDNFPFVLVDRSFPQLKANSIVVDNFAGSYRLTESLIAKGCRNIAYISTDVHLSVMQLRYNGHIKALEDNDLSFDQSLYVEIEKYNYDEEFEKKMGNLFALSSKVDAILFSTHHLAHGVIKYLNQNKILFLSQVEIASFHSNNVLELLVPNLSLVKIPIDEIGSMAVDILLDNIVNPDSDKSERVLELLYQCG